MRFDKNNIKNKNFIDYPFIDDYEDVEDIKKDISLILKAIDDKTLVVDKDEEMEIRQNINIILNSIDNDVNTTDSNDEDIKFKNEINRLSDFFSNNPIDNTYGNNSKSINDIMADVGVDLVEDAGVADVGVDLVEDAGVADVGVDLVEDAGVADVGVDLVEDAGVADVGVDLVEDAGVADVGVDLVGDDGVADDFAIEVDNVTMEYKIVKEKIDTIKEFVIRTIKRNKSKPTKFVALKNVSFKIVKGERVGIIGFNGAGKSTLLKLLSGVYYPTEGTIKTKGKIAPLLELGAGFDNNYSGRDNIFLNGAFLGFSEEFLKEKYDEILEFSELGESINYPVKNYSSGMRAKLGFSIATLVQPDILIIDEILSVGDMKFQKKSSEKLRSLIDSGITVLLVSHSVSQIRDICNKAIWLDKGEIKMFGDVDEVCDAYVEAATDATSDQLKNIKLN